MTNKKGSFPSRKGILKKIFSRKVIGLLIVLLSLLFLTGFYISRPATEVSAEAQERFGIEIVEKHVSSLQESCYEDVSYDVSAIIKMSEENHIPLNITRQPGETLEDMIIMPHITLFILMIKHIYLKMRMTPLVSFKKLVNMMEHNIQ
jgi:hypothetical protein